MSISGIPYDEMPRYIEQYQEEIENLTNSALQLNEIVKEKQQEIERLNNIINKIENVFSKDDRILEFIKELKGCEQNE